MSLKAGLTGFVLLVSLFLRTEAQAVSLNGFADVLEKLADATRTADRARERLDDARRRGGDFSRYEQTWHEDEVRLEQQRIQTVARITGVNEATIRELRAQGAGWGSIARTYDIDPRRLNHGISRYDSERDTWKGTPPGLDKKEGVPPGLDKKEGVPPGRAKKDDTPPGRSKKEGTRSRRAQKDDVSSGKEKNVPVNRNNGRKNKE